MFALLDSNNYLQTDPEGDPTCNGGDKTIVLVARKKHTFC